MSETLIEISIDRLRLRTIIGFQEWERKKPQDVVISIDFRFDASAAIESDNVDDAVDYKVMTKKITTAVEASSYNLIESMAAMVHQIVRETPKVRAARVRVHKPHALRFCDDVSVQISDYD